jgi:hypothetical protein
LTAMAASTHCSANSISLHKAKNKTKFFHSLFHEVIVPHQRQCLHAIEGKFGRVLLSGCCKCAALLGEREQTAREGKHAAVKARRAMHHHGFVRNWGQRILVGVFY